MKILGINGAFGGSYQDAAAALLINGALVSAIEEERITRIKFASGKLPLQAIKAILKQQQLSIKDIDIVAFHGHTWPQAIENKLEQFFYNYFGHCPTIKRYHHHQAHAASTYYASGYKEALIITFDGSGDGISTRISVSNNNQIKTLDEYQRPNSLGIYYTAFTQLCGFQKDKDEYKIMGLAAYGNPTKFNLEEVLSFSNGRYQLNEKFLATYTPGMPSSDNQEMVYNNSLPLHLNIEKRVNEPLTETYKHLAASCQQQLEKTVIQLINYWVKETGISNVCLAGGVALNGLMIYSITKQIPGITIYVPPVAADMGIALGNAYLAAIDNNILPLPLDSAFKGNSFSDEEIETTLKLCNIKYQYCENIVEATTTHLLQNKVIAWFQGKMEYGPRALGNRSIIALPHKKEMKDIINKKVKFRESFRPFGASVLEEDFNTCFHTLGIQTAPYMNRVFEVKNEMIEFIPAVVHFDNTCRVQTVNATQNKLYYELLQHVKLLTHHGVLINTSFNLDNEPIVCTPREAIASFYASGLDVLVIGNYIVTKN